MIDLHCHILPGIDDGPQTMEDSLALARAAAAGGTTTIVATPHVSWGWPHNSAATISAGVRELNDELRAAQIELEVLAGGEVALSRAAELGPAELQALRLGGGPWLLVESPLTTLAPGVELGLTTLQNQGHRILLAHPERCPLFQREPQRLAALVGRGMLTSVTASAFTGRFGRQVQRFAFSLLHDGLVHDVASDAHDAIRRPPALHAALVEAGLGEHAERLAHSAPLAILRGRPVPA
ncbi:MAG: protein-tyrosine phosphatase, partial [Solirubrobacteraceae bacterium]|nr:protein-tyrosine phosphatase [Solirubrobacteraceae bacterium]